MRTWVPHASITSTWLPRYGTLVPARMPAACRNMCFAWQACTVILLLISILFSHACLHSPATKRKQSIRGGLKLQYTRAVQALYCADPLIAALLASGAQHYLEFKLVQARYVAGANMLMHRSS